MRLERGMIVREAKGIATDILASVFWAIAISIFAMPNQIAPGGISGITVIINYLTGYPVGSMSFLLNLSLIHISEPTRP